MTRNIKTGLGASLCAGCYTLILVVLASSAASAFDYEEHATITYDAGKTFCVEYRAQYPNDLDSTPANELCSLDPTLRDLRLRCFAHYAALAADHVGHASELSRTGEGKWLIGDGLDCGQIGSPQPSGLVPPAGDIGSHCDKAKRSHEPSCTLLPPRWSVHFTWEYLGLLATNAPHFSPESHQAWRGTDHLRSGGTDDLTLSKELFLKSPQLWFARAAFRFHFYEDSFPAGHIGEDRRRYHHDYDNAFHDDYNDAGRFLDFEDGSRLFVFGDYNLLRPTHYLPTDQFQTGDAASLLHALAAAFPGYAIGQVRQSDIVPLSSTPDLRVLSIENADPPKLCGWRRSCNKLELVLIHGREELPSLDPPCQIPRTAQDAGIVVYECANETQATVTRAVVVAFWNRFVGECDCDADKRLPKSYYRLVDNMNTGSATINEGTFVLRYASNAQDVETDEHPRQEPFSEYGLSILKEWGTPFHSAGETLAFTTSASGIGKAVATALGADADPGHSLLSRKSVSPSDWYNVDVRFNLIDSTHQILTGAEAGVDFRDAVSIAHLIGLTPSLGVGVDDFWAGSRRRNVYAGAGIALDLHIAKYAISVGAWRELHYNSTYRTWNEWRGVIGFRVMSIDLDRVQ